MNLINFLPNLDAAGIISFFCILALLRAKRWYKTGIVVLKFHRNDRIQTILNLPNSYGGTQNERKKCFVCHEPWLKKKMFRV
jgi:hypothetical protein